MTTFSYDLGHLNAIHRWHSNIYKCHIYLTLLQRIKSLMTVSSHSDHVNVGDGAEEAAELTAVPLVIISQEYADQLLLLRGSTSVLSHVLPPCLAAPRRCRDLFLPLPRGTAGRLQATSRPSGARS